MDKELNPDRSQDVSFTVEMSGQVSSADFRLRIESGKGYDLTFKGNHADGKVTFSLPRMPDSIAPGNRKFFLECVADKEAFFSPYAGEVLVKNTLKVEAAPTKEAKTISVKVVKMESEAEKSPPSVQSKDDDLMEISF